MRKGAKAAVIGGVFAIMVGGAGYGAYNVVTAVTGSGGSSTAGAPSPRRTGPPTADEVKDVSQKFLAAWAKSDPDSASRYTNNAEAALSALTGWHDDAHITHTTLTAGAPSGPEVPFKVKATVSYEGKKKSLSYDSSLKVVRGLNTGRALVDWQTAVVHPDMRRGDILVTGEASTPPIEAVDRSGNVLTKEKYPSLGPILDQLREKYGDTAGGRAGVETYIQRESEDAGTKTLITLVKGKAGELRTTLSATAQAAAERAVKSFDESSVVAVQPSTGQVLAVANHRRDGFNAAFQGEQAPGSTMKVITAALLIDNGVASVNSPAPCPDTATWQSQTFHNLPGMKANEGANLADSFARSCNTAFVKLIDEKPLTDESLTREAQDRHRVGGRQDPAVRRPRPRGQRHRAGPDPDEPAEHGVRHGDREDGRLPAAGDRAALPRRPGTRHRPRPRAQHRRAAAADDVPHRDDRHRRAGHGGSRPRHRRQDRLGGGHRPDQVEQLVHRLPRGRRGGRGHRGGRPRRRRRGPDRGGGATGG
jgi:hypothetical protein